MLGRFSILGERRRFLPRGRCAHHLLLSALEDGGQCIYLGPCARRYEFWLDAGTGAIVGAGRWGTLAAQPAPHKGLLLTWVKRPLQIKVYARDPKYGWGKYPEVILNQENRQALIRALSDSPVVKTELVATPGYKLAALGDGERDPRTVYYAPSKNLIGVPGDWYQAPAALKARLAKVGGSTVHNAGEAVVYKVGGAAAHK